jgi:hypothetical protein
MKQTSSAVAFAAAFAAVGKLIATLSINLGATEY